MSISKRLVAATSAAARLVSGAALGAALAGAIVLASPTTSRAQAQPASPQAPAPVGPALWVARDADSTVYLFGTVHLLKPETEWRTAMVDDALSSADEVWMEIADINDASQAPALLQRLGLSPSRPLSAVLTADELAALDAAARQLGASAEAMEPMRPWLAALQISVAAIVKAGFDPASGVEPKLKAAADAAGIPVRGFETMEQQFGYLAGLSEPVQVAFLNQAVAQFAEAEVMLGGMVDAWAVGDIARFEAITLEDFESDYSELYDAILVRRNADWTGQIQTILEGEGVTFVAVGALHLAGDDSVQSMLEARGVTVERVGALAD